MTQQKESVVTPERFATGMTYDQWMKHIQRNVPKFEFNYAQTTVPADYAKRLKALADKAMQRNQSLTKDLAPDSPGESREVSLVVVAAGAGLVPDLRRLIDTALEQDAKQWRFEGEAPQLDGAVGLRYQVRCRKRLPAPALAVSLRRAAGTLAQDVILQ